MFPSAEYLFSDMSLHEQRFRRMKTLKTGYSHLFINILFLLLVIGICLRIDILSPWNDVTSLYFGQAVFWLISLISHYIYVKDHWYLKIRGHFKYYKFFKTFTDPMIATPSFFNVILVIIQGVLSKYADLPEKYVMLHHNIVAGTLIFEISLTLLIVIAYLGAVHKFNSSKPTPDTETNEYFLLSDASSASEIGYRLAGEALADVLEKQADYICYLKATLDELNSVLMSTRIITQIGPTVPRDYS